MSGKKCCGAVGDINSVKITADDWSAASIGDHYPNSMFGFGLVVGMVMCIPVVIWSSSNAAIANRVAKEPTAEVTEITPVNKADPQAVYASISRDLDACKERFEKEDIASDLPIHLNAIESLRMDFRKDLIPSRWTPENEKRLGELKAMDRQTSTAVEGRFDVFHFMQLRRMQQLDEWRTKHDANK